MNPVWSPHLENLFFLLCAEPSKVTHKSRVLRLSHHSMSVSTLFLLLFVSLKNLGSKCRQQERVWGIFFFFFFFIDGLYFRSHSASPPPFQNKHSSSRAQCGDVNVIRNTVEKLNFSTRIKSSSQVLFFFFFFSFFSPSCN